MREEVFDVVIVGAGIAGSTLAYFLAREGYKVAVIERVERSNIGWKPCGDAIGKHYFDELGIEPPHGEELEQIVHGIDIYSPSGEHRIRVKGEGYMVNTPAFVKRILGSAIGRGAVLYDNTYALEPVLDKGYVVGVIAKRGKSRILFKSKLLVDASGNAAVIRRRLPKNIPLAEEADPTEFNIAYREIRLVEKEIDEPEYIRIYINQEIAPGGYWWYFPKGKYKVNVGLGVQAGVGNPSPKELFYKYLARMDLVKGEILHSAGAPVPTRRPLSTLVWNGVASIGDAAYTVNPVHGGGKGSSMIAAYCLAKAFSDAYDKGDFSAKALWNTNKCYIERYGAKQASLDILRIFLQKMDNQDYEFIIAKKLIDSNELYELSTEASLTSKIVSRILKAVIVGLSKPSLLLRLKRVVDYMNKVKEHYMNYPEQPEDLEKWLAKLNSIYKEFIESIR